jgi:hypothetical protein
LRLASLDQLAELVAESAAVGPGFRLSISCAG